jgi:hypothetical protein
MTATMTVIETMDPASRLQRTLAEVDHLLHLEMNRARHITLSKIRQDLTVTIAHLESGANQ